MEKRPSHNVSDKNNGTEDNKIGKVKLSDFSDDNIDSDPQHEGMPDNQDNKPVGKSVNEATDPSKLSQL